jgi:hypothetical protein
MKTKTALTQRPLSPEERLVASYLAGKGLYGALQLKNQAFDDDGVEPESDVLKIKLPKEKLMSFDKMSEEHEPDNHLIGNFHSMLKNPLAIGMSGLAGFTHGSKLYEDMEKQHLDDEMSKAEKEYLDLLGQIKHSSDNSTPCVDAFVTGMVSIASASPEEIEKEANQQDDMSDGSIQRMFGDMASPVTNLFKPVTDTAKGLTTASTLGSALAVYMLKQKMDAGKQHSSNPQRIEVEAI